MTMTDSAISASAANSGPSLTPAPRAVITVAWRRDQPGGLQQTSHTPGGPEEGRLRGFVLHGVTPSDGEGRENAHTAADMDDLCAATFWEVADDAGRKLSSRQSFGLPAGDCHTRVCLEERV
jgi:hypothetical protein